MCIPIRFFLFTFFRLFWFQQCRKKNIILDLLSRVVVGKNDGDDDDFAISRTTSLCGKKDNKKKSVFFSSLSYFRNSLCDPNEDMSLLWLCVKRYNTAGYKK